MTMEKTRNVKRKIGVVASNAMDKSVTVVIGRTVMDPVFKKHIRRKTKIMAHDESNQCGVGDVVAIHECRPISKRKRWRVEKVLEKATEISG